MHLLLAVPVVLVALLIVYLLYRTVRDLWRQPESLNVREEAAGKGHPYRDSGLQPNGDGKGVWNDKEFVIGDRDSDEVMFACGHEGPTSFSVTILGKDATPTKKFFEDRPYCPACLRSMFIRCVLCGEPIFPGQPVAAYGDMRRFKKAWKTYADAERRSVIGCMAWDCCPSGGFFAGTWTGTRIDSPFATGSAVGDAFAAGPGKMVVTNVGPDGVETKTVDIGGSGDKD